MLLLSHGHLRWLSIWRKDDEDLNNGESAYEWVAINKLAKEDKDETTISKIRPLKNAGKHVPIDYKTFCQK